MAKMSTKQKIETKENYISNLKLTIMDEVFYVYCKSKNAMAIIANWFEINDKCSPESWARMDRMLIKDIWQIMINRVVLK